MTFLYSFWVRWEKQQSECEAKYNSWKSFSLYTNSPIIRVSYVSSIMPCSMRNIREVLWKSKIWLGGKYDITHDNVGQNPKMMFMHREATGHCGTVFGIYYKEEIGLEWGQDGWAWFALEKGQHM